MSSLPLNDHEMLKLAGTIGRFAAGTYECPCYDCGQTFMGAKDARQCLPCAVASLKAAQETICDGDITIKPLTEDQLALMIEAGEAGEIDPSCPSCGGTGRFIITHNFQTSEGASMWRTEQAQCRECSGTGIKTWPT
jgi:hypothetical protein